jgi:hypothetical protein
MLCAEGDHVHEVVEQDGMSRFTTATTLPFPTTGFLAR